MSDGSVAVPIPGDRKSVGELAYRLWELSGRTHGNDVVHWVLAELLLTQYVTMPLVRYKVGAGGVGMDGQWIKGGAKIRELLQTKVLDGVDKLLVETDQ